MNGNTILLFDIDGTLISTGGAGRRAFMEAFQEITGADNAFEGYSFAGRTDRAIVRAGLRAANILESDAAIDAVLNRYLQRLEETLVESADYVVHPGVPDVVEELAANRVALGIGTGNVEKGARIKLERANLNRWFSFGGFGCDAEERAALIQAGARRGASHLGHPLSACSVIVIGDTLRDVAAAHAVGAKCMGVGTGGVSRTDFEGAGAEWFFDTLREEDAVRTLVQLARGS